MIPRPQIAKWQQHAPWKEFSQVEQDLIITCFKNYTSFATGKKPPGKKQFLLNIEEKENSLSFSGDMEALLRKGIKYNQNEAFDWLKKELIVLI